MKVQAVAVYARADAEYALPSKSAIKEKQMEAIKVVGGVAESAAPFGPAAPDNEHL